MKSYIVVIVLAFALWWEYNNRLKKKQGTRPGQRRPKGVTSGFSSGVRQATQFSSTGSTSPGSGVIPIQPSLSSSWGISGPYGAGYTGVTYAQSGK